MTGTNIKGKTIVSKLRLTIRKPSVRRRSFSIVKDEVSGGLRKQQTWDNKEFDIINERVKFSQLAIDTAFRLVLDLKERELKRLRAADTDKNIAFHKDNQRYVGRLLEEASTKDIRKTSLLNTEIDYKRILTLLGEKSILTITKRELKDLLDVSPYAFSVKNKIVCRINLLLKEAGRSFKLSKYTSIGVVLPP